MPAYVVANIRVHDAEAYEEYKRLVPKTIERYGGRYLARGGRAEVAEGGLEAGRVILLEFPTYEDAQRWHSSPEYAAAKTIRQNAATGDLALLEGM